MCEVRHKSAQDHGTIQDLRQLVDSAKNKDRTYNQKIHET